MSLQQCSPSGQSEIQENCRVVILKENTGLNGVTHQAIQQADIVIDAEGKCVKNRWGNRYDENRHADRGYAGYKMSKI